jgi:hypothetical protein
MCELAEGGDQRSQNKAVPEEVVSLDHLERLGVLYWRLDPTL